MNDDSFDKELTALYQQRKSQLNAPNVRLSAAVGKKHISVIKLLSILTVGGIASFGIMAIMSHFASNPTTSPQAFTTTHPVNITKESNEVVNDDVLVIKPKLPPKPEAAAFASDVNLLAPVKHSVPASGVENIKINTVQRVKLPSLKEPDLLIKPIHTVMPKYSHKSLQARESGSITLRYEIDEAGHVKNIIIVNTEVGRELQRSATKALSKWQYNAADNEQKSYEIIFEFNLNE